MPTGKKQELWLHVPNLSALELVSHSVQDMPGLISDCISQNPSIELFVLSSDKVMPRLLSWPGWKTRAWIKLLYGTILQPLTAAHGAEKWIASLPDIPVNPFPLQDIEKQKMILDTSGHISKNTLKPSDQPGCFSKTLKVTSTEDFTRSQEIYRTWAIELKRDCFRRMKLAGLTGGVGCSYWPTPTFSNSGTTSEIQLSEKGIVFYPNTKVKGSQIHIKEVSLNWTLLWMYLHVMGWKPGKKMMEYPYSLHLQLIITPGGRFSKADLIFNPMFLELVMGWPIGWSDAREPVTGLSRWLQRMRGALSRLR